MRPIVHILPSMQFEPGHVRLYCVCGTVVATSNASWALIYGGSFFSPGFAHCRLCGTDVAQASTACPDDVSPEIVERLRRAIQGSIDLAAREPRRPYIAPWR